MTVEEIKEKKELAESKINGAIQLFYAETWIMPIVNVETYDSFGTPVTDSVIVTLTIKL